MSAASPDLQSLDDLEGTTWGPAPADATTLVVKVHALRQQPIGQLSPADLRLLLGQGVGIAVLLPRALDLLKHNPLVEADFYPGDLLAAVLRLPQSYWREHPDSAQAATAVLDAASELPPELATAAMNFRSK